MAQRESIILFGEGKADAAFLRHLCAMYREELRGTRIKIDAGRGGSPKQLLLQLINKHLRLANYDRALVLLDEDLGRDGIPAKWLREHPVEIVESAPSCLEGMLLELLGSNLIGKEAKTSACLKRAFRKEHLGTDRDTEIVRRLADAYPKLYPRELLDEKRAVNTSFDAILTFLKL